MSEAPAMTSVADVEEALRDVVYGVHIDDGNVATVDMTLTSAACPLTDVIEDQTRAALDGLVADFRINWVWMPPWGPDKITDEGREMLRALGFNV
jgi:metal-sulfur cluster biosynthetic enzyme